MPQGEISGIQDLLPYILAATSIIVSAAAYYIRDALRERNRLVRQKNDLDVAKREMDLKLNQQEMSYKRELQETINHLNEQMSQMQERHQQALNQEIGERLALERRITELESQHRLELQAVIEAKERLAQENERLKAQD